MLPPATTYGALILPTSPCSYAPPLSTRLARLQVLQWATAAVKQTKAAHYRGCSADDLLGLISSDSRRLYLVLHNIDGPGMVFLCVFVAFCDCLTAPLTHHPF